MSANSTPKPGGPIDGSPGGRRHATTPLSDVVPIDGTVRSSVTVAPVGTSSSVSRNNPPRYRLIEYATRNDDAVRNSTCTEYGIRWCSRSDTIGCEVSHGDGHQLHRYSKRSRTRSRWSRLR